MISPPSTGVPRPSRRGGGRWPSWRPCRVGGCGRRCGVGAGRVLAPRRCARRLGRGVVVVAAARGGGEGERERQQRRGSRCDGGSACACRFPRLSPWSRQRRSADPAAPPPARSHGARAAGPRSQTSVTVSKPSSNDGDGQTTPAAPRRCADLATSVAPLASPPWCRGSRAGRPSVPGCGSARPSAPGSTPPRSPGG